MLEQMMELRILRQSLSGKQEILWSSWVHKRKENYIFWELLRRNNRWWWWKIGFLRIEGSKSEMQIMEESGFKIESY